MATKNTDLPHQETPQISPQQDLYDEHFLIVREFTRVDFSENDELHRLGYYWPSSVAAQPTK